MFGSESITVRNKLSNLSPNENNDDDDDDDYDMGEDDDDDADDDDDNDNDDDGGDDENDLPGEENSLAMRQTYTHRFQCRYLLHRYPFDTQVLNSHSQN